MLKIGEFSKLSHTTVKALRFYEKEALLIPASVDEWTGYRLYESSQLETAAKIKSFRQLGLSIDEIKSIFSGEDVKKILSEKEKELKNLQQKTERRRGVRPSPTTHPIIKCTFVYHANVRFFRG